MHHAAPASALVAIACLLLAHGTSASEGQRMDLIRILSDHPWLQLGGRWPPSPRLRPGQYEPPLDQEMPEQNAEAEDKNSDEDATRENSEKRSAVATALNAGRRRRQQVPALGVLNDVGSFFNSLRDKVETLASLSPQQRATLMQEPSVVRARQSAPASRIGGSSMRRMFPTRLTGNIRSYNRRSFVEAEAYPGANHHDPALLWTGLGR